MKRDEDIAEREVAAGFSAGGSSPERRHVRVDALGCLK